MIDGMKRGTGGGEWQKRMGRQGKGLLRGWRGRGAASERREPGVEKSTVE